MSWVDRHAAAVQALASIASLLVAVVLAVLTGWYVRLTRSIANASKDQAAFLRDSFHASRQQQAASLASLAERVRAPLADLQLNHGSLFHYAHLTEDDVQALEALARTVDADAASLASEAAVALRSLLGVAEYARSFAISYGWHPSPQDQRRWDDAHPKALDRLKALIAHSRQVATQA